MSPRPAPVPRPVDRADQALPPGRLHRHAGQDIRLVRTFLSPTAWRVLCQAGRLTGAATDDELLHRPYTWMRQQMTRRLGTPQEIHPLWFWVQTTRGHLVDEARSYLRDQPGTVLATCRIAADRLLVSDFMDWSYVLLNSPVWPDGPAFDDAEFDRWHDELERACPDVDRLFPDEWPEPFRSRTLTSWQVMFDVTRPPRNRLLQGCLAELLLDDIVDAVQLGSPPGADR